MPDWRKFVQEQLPPLDLGGAREAEIAEELADQLEDRYEELRAAGVGENEAYARAAAQFPQWAKLAAAIRIARRRKIQSQPEMAPGRKGMFMGNFLQEMRYAVRSLANQLGYSAVVILTLALGIGANTAIFNVVYGVLLQPLPYPEPERLVRIWDRHAQSGTMFFSVNPNNFFDWRAGNRSFEQLGAYREDTLSLALEGGEPEAIEGARVTQSLLDVLRVAPLHGRNITSDEDVPGGNVALLAHGLWLRRFGGREDVIGQSVRVNGAPHRIVGVLPASFRFPQQDRLEVLIPLALQNDPNARGAHFLRVLGRLKPGVSQRAAEADLNELARRAGEEFPRSNKGWTAVMRPLHEATVGSIREPLLVLMAAVGIVLLIACANIANLTLVRAAARRREIATRIALGASRWQLARQMLCEGLVLALAGGAVGLVIAAWAGPMLLRMGPGDLPRMGEVRWSGPVFLFSGALMLAITLVFALVGAMPSFSKGVQEGLREKAGTGSRASGRLRNALLVSEVAFAVVLLVGASLLGQTWNHLAQAKPGFDTSERVVAARITPLAAAYPTPQGRAAFFTQLLQRLAAAPGIESAGLAHRLPLDGNSGMSIGIPGRAVPSGEALPMVNYRSVTNGYFTAMGIPLQQGRFFTEKELAEKSGVLLVNRAFASRYFPGEEAVGKQLNWRGESFEIIGIVADAKEDGLSIATQPATYVPYGAYPAPGVTLVVRTANSVESAAAAVRAAVREVNPNQSVASFQTMKAFISQVIAQPRFNAALLGAFAVLALALASVGLYGVIAYSVAQRTSEIGIRVALGAQRGAVMRMVLGYACRLAGIGLAIGIAGSLFLTRYVQAMLFGVGERDMATFLGVAALLVVVTACASAVPARRALGVDPLVALRHE